jgi:hypothetical protein
MIRCGMLAGFGFLIALALVEWLARPGVRSVPGPGVDHEVTDQVWAVLAEARKILEESA